MTAPRRGWWRRNGLGLAAFAVLLPATVAVTSWNGWADVFSQRPSVAIDESPSGPFAFGAAEWRVVDSARGRPEQSDVPLPEGMQLVVAQVEVTPNGEEGIGCTIELVERATGRTFVADSFDGYWDASPDTTAGCDSERIDPYVVELPFMVPDDAGEVSLTIAVVSELPSFVRVPLEIEARQ